MRSNSVNPIVAGRWVRPSGWLVVFSLLLLVACAPVMEDLPGRPIPAATGHQLLDDWQAKAQLVTSIQGMAKVRVETPERSVSGTQVVLAERPDRLRAETLSPFGTPMLMMASDGDDLGVLLPTQGVYYAGSATPANLARFTRIPLKFADLVSMLLYQTPVIGYDELRSFALEDGSWLVQLEGDPLRQQLSFGPDRSLVTSRYLEGKELLLQVSYARFEDLVVSFPHEFAIELPGQETTATLNFSELAVNRSFQPGIFHIEPRPGTKIYPLDDSGLDSPEVSSPNVRN